MPVTLLKNFFQFDLTYTIILVSLMAVVFDDQVLLS